MSLKLQYDVPRNMIRQSPHLSLKTPEHPGHATEMDEPLLSVDIYRKYKQTVNKYVIYI